jgi:cation transport regulator
VKDHLPEHAHDIFRAAFNQAFQSHEGEPDQEERAFRIAWAAVKKKFAKAGSRWIAR